MVEISPIVSLKREIKCAVCDAPAEHWADIDGYAYLKCGSCQCIAINPESMALVDAGLFPVKYDQKYWDMELSAAKQRSWGSSLAIVAEAILYCGRPIERFIDIGSGPGYLLDSLSTYLPNKTVFHGVEMFPPPVHTDHKNYHVGDLGSLEVSFDAGVCVEMIEHLTPNMVRMLAADIARKSRPGSLFVFNTGLSTFVIEEDASYLDPLVRGHIVAWGLPALVDIFGQAGFVVHPLRNWAFAIEFMPAKEKTPMDRVWDGLNAHLLRDPSMGDVMYSLGVVSAMAFARR